ncbi:iron-containing alcohol dehydrogenase [Sphingobium sp.]|uniref:iron-containing alcohol dehydrogenase n=1 Tax=Sphingobium sp. TaxID=1912891 RepID=UPI003B3B8CFC
MVEEVALRSGWVTPQGRQSVAFGLPMTDALPEAVARLSMKRIAVVTTRSLAGEGGLAHAVAQRLGDRFDMMISGVDAHTPRRSVIRVAEQLATVDGVVTIGGSSVHDTVKAARLCLANGVRDADGMDRFRARVRKADGVAVDEGPDPTVAPTLPFIAIPTTLSAGEFTSGVGVTDERGPIKKVYVYPQLSPDIVILDPAMTSRTPGRLFFSSGMRAVDHAIESWCSINPTPLSEACSLHAARLLMMGMRAVFDNPQDMQARLDCQEGAWLSILMGSAMGVKTGASHGLGHALGGTGGMLHGDTSCIMLPHVLRYNAPVNADRQAVIAASLGRSGEALGDIVGELVAYLNLPTRLRDAGIDRADIDRIAQAAIHDVGVKHNPRPIDGIAGVRTLLQHAW